MTETLWTEVDHYFTDRLVEKDPVLDEALAASDAAGLPPIAVAPNQGKLLHLLARMRGAKRILEIGTLGGYSTIWLARALPADGELISLEYSAKHAEVARANLAAAGLSSVAEVRVGPALESLPELTGPFDLVFIDADKRSNAEYFRWALRLSTVGSLIIVDNVVRDGRVVDAGVDDANVRGTRAVIEAMGAEPRVSATAVQTVGTKGYDGFAMALVVSA
jgi:predicted O-methyltransferase YrrM